MKTCPNCSSEYGYPMSDFLYACPECGHEWNPDTEDTEIAAGFAPLVAESLANVSPFTSSTRRSDLRIVDLGCKKIQRMPRDLLPLVAESLANGG
jgi:hypothetical protein